MPRQIIAPLVPSPMPVRDVLDANTTLQSLAHRLRESQARLAVVSAVLPSELRGHVQSGVLDEAHWHLLVPSAAMSAKLRQLVPAMQDALRAAGFAPRTISLRIASVRR